MRLLVGNFDFEHHLGPGELRPLSAGAARLNAMLAGSLASLAEEGDCIWTPAPFEPDYPRHLSEIGLPIIRCVRERQEVERSAILCPWGWTDDLLAWGTRNGWTCPCPPMETVITANSRALSHRLEREWNVGPSAARECRSLDDFRQALEGLSSSTDGWVVKGEFGMSARERIIGKGRTPTDQAIAWIRRRLRQESAVYFEPWLDRVSEVGFQFTLKRNGDPVLEGATPLLCDERGAYRGSRLVNQPGFLSTVPAKIVQTIERAAAHVQALGYFGPLGIDAMQYRDADGQTRWRPLQDINARLSMGRVALGLRSLLRPGEQASWLHVRWSDLDEARPSIDERISRLSARMPAGTRIVRTSPLEVERTPAERAALLVLAPSSEVLQEAEAQIVRSKAKEPRTT